ncbi:hypothetical protein IAR55_000011 [Kwoniella newhampshirensis]|uniref:ATPase BadF/BadG/BcrA/BcrD type domain-containing protein n=1 Tax=Kwoniella newhampshirensis TaxID=1651941 RepID=A0AAW0Z5G9_9TREE
MLQPPEGLYLCVDAGGTKTAAAIANAEGEIVGRGYGGSANMSELGVETSSTEILRAVDQAISSLRLPSGVAANGHTAFIGDKYRCRVHFERIWVGISGCDSPNDVINMTRRLEHSFVDDSPGGPSRHRIHRPGAEPAFFVSLYLRDVREERGHGHLFGDPGSGYHMGLTAIAMAADDHGLGHEREGGLAAVLRKVYRVESTADVPARAHDVPMDLDPVAASNARKLRIASLAPHVLNLSTTCPLAACVLTRVTGALADDIAVLESHAKSKGLSGSGGLVITGGLGTQDRYFQSLLSALNERGVTLGWADRIDDAAGAGAAALSEIR